MTCQKDKMMSTSYWRWRPRNILQKLLGTLSAIKRWFFYQVVTDMSNSYMVSDWNISDPHHTVFRTISRVVKYLSPTVWNSHPKLIWLRKKIEGDSTESSWYGSYPTIVPNVMSRNFLIPIRSREYRYKD